MDYLSHFGIDANLQKCSALNIERIRDAMSQELGKIKLPYESWESFKVNLSPCRWIRLGLQKHGFWDC